MLAVSGHEIRDPIDVRKRLDVTANPRYTAPMKRIDQNENRDSDTMLYDAFAGRDARCDGVYFMGVSSTGIYCRPVCTAKTPRAS